MSKSVEKVTEDSDTPENLDELETEQGISFADMTSFITQCKYDKINIDANPEGRDRFTRIYGRQRQLRNRSSNGYDKARQERIRDGLIKIFEAQVEREKLRKSSSLPSINRSSHSMSGKNHVSEKDHKNRGTDSLMSALTRILYKHP